MTSLPSFVELMASLGLDQDKNNKPDQFSNSSRSSPSTSPRLAGAFVPLHSRSKSTHSLRDSSIAARQRVNRYAPYFPSISATRRASISSVSCPSSDTEKVPLRDISTSPRLAKSALLSRRSSNSLSIRVYRSASDFTANTPISSFVRRKTPCASPTSPTFVASFEAQHNARDAPPSPLIIPTLPVLYPSSANSESFPITPTDSELSLDTEPPSRKSAGLKSRHGRPQRVGIRLSSPFTFDDAEVHSPRRGSLARVA